MEFKKNQIVEVIIEDIGINGEGIGKISGYPLFIKDAVVGDRVRAVLTKVKKTYAYAHLNEILEPSPDRTAAPCEAAKTCGGCQLQAYTYEKQLDIKQNKVRNNLIRIGGFDAEQIDGLMQPVIGMDHPWYYRNKAQYPVGTDKDGNPITGFYAGHSHRIVPCENCLLNRQENRRILKIVLDYMKRNSIPAYDEETGKGVVRHILTRCGFTSGEWMVCLVINSKDSRVLVNVKELLDALMEIPGMTSISYSSNTERTNVIMGKHYVTLAGRSTITDTIGDCAFELSPLSFFQVNPEQTVKLYGKALEYAGLTGGERVWDLYCGIGTISLFLARKAGHVYGVEIIPDAIEDAKENAKRNDLLNTTFLVGKAEEVLPKHYKETGEGADVIVVDPPRKGCEKSVLDTMLAMKPERIVYVSCDSATLARDLKILCEGDGTTRYEIKKVQPVDMFPQTVHVETVCLLSRE